MKISLRGIIIFSMILLTFFGLLTILSSQSEAAAPYYLALRQLISFGLAAGLMFLCSTIPFAFYKKNALFLAALFLLAVLILPFFRDPYQRHVRLVPLRELQLAAHRDRQSLLSAGTGGAFEILPP